MADHFYVIDRGAVSYDRAKSDLSKEDLAAAFTV
jgi:ABC-type branched-subunit amino acid transport system ATPase component